MHRYVAVASMFVLAGWCQSAAAQGQYRASTWYSIPTVPRYTAAAAPALRGRPVLAPIIIGAQPAGAPIVVAPQVGYAAPQSYIAPQVGYTAPQSYAAPQNFAAPQTGYAAPQASYGAAPSGAYGVPADYPPTLAPSAGTQYRYGPSTSSVGSYGHTTRGSFPTDDIAPVTYASPTTSGAAISAASAQATTVPSIPPTTYSYSTPIQPSYPAATTRYAPTTTYSAPAYAATTPYASSGSFGRTYVPNTRPTVQVPGQPPVVIVPQQAYGW